MHQVSLEELSTQIPRCIQHWSCEDVCTWLALNQIQFDAPKIHANNINGPKAKKMKPNQWMNTFNFTKFIAKQIVQWLDEDGDEFDELVRQNQAGQEHTNISELDCHNFQQRKQLKQGGQIMPSFQRGYQKSQNNKLIYLAQVKQPQIKSSPQIIEFRQQYSQAESEKLQDQCDKLSSEDKRSQQLSSFGSGPSNNEGEDKDQICSLKSEQKYKIGELEMRKNNSEVTQRVERKNKNQPPNKLQISPLERNINKEADIFQKEGTHVVKNKKDQVRLLNQKLKVKQKQISKTPKLYSYINANYSSNQNIASNKAVLKKVTSAQEIPNLKKMNWPEAENEKKIKVQYSPAPSTTISNGLENPHVKFVSSEFVSCLGENFGRPIREKQKMLKLTYPPGVDKVIMGYSKIGRAASNDIVFAEESVSRTHAEIILNLKMNGENSFILKDLGSRFGTYVECKGMQQGIQGKSYFIGDSEIQIVSVEPSKNSISLYKKQTFDLKIRIDKDRQMSLLNRSNVYIGNRLSSDVKLDSSSESARIWMDKNKKFYIEGVEGKIYLKLKQHEQWDIQSHLDNMKKVEVVFGWFKVSLEIFQTCVICTKKTTSCSCPSQQQSWKKNRPY